jgi:DNA invertase Pin-like site-specific DNA recombinase
MASKNRRRPQPAKQRSIPHDVPESIRPLVDAQRDLVKAQELVKRAQDRRRQYVRTAFTAGVSSREIARLTGISRAMVYRLISN